MSERYRLSITRGRRTAWVGPSLPDPEAACQLAHDLARLFPPGSDVTVWAGELGTHRYAVFYPSREGREE